MVFTLLAFSFNTFATTPVVFVDKAKTQEIFDLVSYPARAESKINAEIIADADGVVTSVPSRLGSPVSKGQPILVLQHVDPIYQYAPMSVAAPVSGVVGILKVTLGTRVNKGQSLATIIQPSAVRLLVELTATDLNLVRFGMKGEFVSADDKTLVAPVRIIAVSPLVDPGTGTATCELEVTQEKGQKKPSLSPGMIGQVNFKLNRRDGLLVPEQAVQYNQKNPFVRVVKEGLAQRVPVQLGRKQMGSFEIVKGLASGDEFISRSNGHIVDGGKVEVQKADGAVK